MTAKSEVPARLSPLLPAGLPPERLLGLVFPLCALFARPLSAGGGAVRHSGTIASPQSQDVRRNERKFCGYRAMILT